MSRMDVSSIRAFKEVAKDLYLQSLIEPETYSAKIPSPLPIASATASLRDNFTITPNVSGKFLLIIDPFNNKGRVYSEDDVDGQGTGTKTEDITFGQDNTIIDQFRLVSSSVIIRYYGNFNQMSGMFIGATTSNVTNATDNTFLNFNTIEDMPNKVVSKCVDGLKLIYSPMDNKSIEFTPGSKYTSGHPCLWQYLFVICGELFPNTSCIRVDYFRNIEYTTMPAYREYIPLTRSVPMQFELPIVTNLATVAPTVLGNREQNQSWDMKLLSALNNRGVYVNPSILSSLS